MEVRSASVDSSPMELSAGATSVVISSSHPVPVDHSLVTVKVSYPENFKGKKYMAEGKEYQVSAQSAQMFVELGIAQIVKK
jgi:hypothetical protein